MNKDELNNLTEKLTNKLKDTSREFLMNEIDDGEELNDVMAIVLSGSLSATFNILRALTSWNDIARKNLETLVGEVLLTISKQHGVGEIEVRKSKGG